MADRNLIDKISDDTLDRVLALQLLVAWAGEGLCDPKRLDWWKTDLIDEMGGGDLFARLLPKTHKWASLEAARKAALHVDQKARAKLANPDSVRTLFFWGFHVDEKLADRLAFHKKAAKDPTEVLEFLMPLGADFDKAAFESSVKELDAGKHKVAPSGRELNGKIPDDLEAQARKLAAALVPFANSYPMPFFTAEA